MNREQSKGQGEMVKSQKLLTSTKNRKLWRVMIAHKYVGMNSNANKRDIVKCQTLVRATRDKNLWRAIIVSVNEQQSK